MWSRWSRLVDWVDCHTGGPEIVEYEPRWYPLPQPDPVTDRERLMRHTGNAECAIPEHADALRRLGRAIQERDDARRALDAAIAVLLAQSGRGGRAADQPKQSPARKDA